MIFLRNIPVALKHYLPQFVTDDKRMGNLLDAATDEHEKQRLLFQDLTNQFFVNTATWGLADWERLLQIYPRSGATYEERRRSILLRLQIKQTSTLGFMGKLVQRYLDEGDAFIEEHNEEYWFRIVMDGNLIDKPGLLDAINLYKPAHLGCRFMYRLIGDTLKEEFSGEFNDDEEGSLGAEICTTIDDWYPYGAKREDLPTYNGFYTYGGAVTYNGRYGYTGGQFYNAECPEAIIYGYQEDLSIDELVYGLKVYIEDTEDAYNDDAGPEIGLSIYLRDELPAEDSSGPADVVYLPPASGQERYDGALCYGGTVIPCGIGEGKTISAPRFNGMWGHDGAVTYDELIAM